MLQGVWKRMCIIILAGFIAVGSVGCSGPLSEDIIDTLLEEEYIESFYGTGVQKQIINDRVVEKINFTEWKDGNNKYRMNIVSETEKDAFEVGKKQDKKLEELDKKSKDETEIKNLQYIFNDDKMVIYYPEENKYFVKDTTLADAVNDTMAQGINSLTINGSAQEYTMTFISELTQNFDVEIEDDVKVNGRNTQHLIAEGKTLDYKDVRMEAWIDQRTWLIFKQRQEQGNYVLEYEYSDFEINAKCDQKFFDTSVDENAEVAKLGKDFYKVNKNIKIEEIPDYFEGICYELLQSDGLTFVSAKYIEGINDTKGSITLTYKTKEGKEILVDNMPTNNIISEVDTGGEKLKIGYLDALYYERSNFKLIRIIQSDVVCDIYAQNNEVSKEELIGYAKRLKVIKK